MTNERRDALIAKTREHCKNGCAHDVETALIEALDEALEETAQTKSEVERLRGIIESARSFINEDMLGCAAIVLDDTGADVDTLGGQAAIKEGLDQRDIEEAAVRVATCSEAEMADALARLREALRAAGRVGGE